MSDGRRWSALMVGEGHGLISPLGDKFESSPSQYERLEVVPATELPDTSRTCANCKNWEPGKGKLLGGCDVLSERLEINFVDYDGDAIDIQEIATRPDFGCVGFEQKD